MCPTTTPAAHDTKLKSLAENILKLAKPNAADDIADIVIALAEKR